VENKYGGGYRINLGKVSGQAACPFAQYRGDARRRVGLIRKMRAGNGRHPV
jgi:hypothetical protein